jgi:1,4-dihydroxy-2-naphthoyl-CoA hydrolase
VPSLPPNQLTELLGLMPFSEGLGVKLEIAEPSTVAGILAWSVERCTSDGILHGGAIVTLVDTLAGICAYLNLPEERRHPRSSRRPTSSVACAPVSYRTVVVQTDLVDDQDRSVALVIQTQAVLQRD